MGRFDEPAWSAWEKKVALDIGGDLVRASGRFDLFKGDVKTDRFLIDCKETASSGFDLHDSFWGRLSSWARNEQRVPAVAVRAESPEAEVAVVDELTFAETSALAYDTSQIEPRRQVQKRIGASCGAGRPTLFQVGRYRLVAYPYEAFVRDMEALS